MLRREKDRKYSLELTTNHIVDDEEHISYVAFGVRLVLHSGEEIFHYKDISFHQERLQQYLNLILKSDVPYYQIQDLIEDYLLSRCNNSSENLFNGF
jgi:hypothetical protein